MDIKATWLIQDLSLGLWEKKEIDKTIKINLIDLCSLVPTLVKINMFGRDSQLHHPLAVPYHSQISIEPKKKLMKSFYTKKFIELLHPNYQQSDQKISSTM